MSVGSPEQTAVKYEKKNPMILIYKNAFDNVVWQMSAILGRPQCVDGVSFRSSSSKLMGVLLSSMNLARWQLLFLNICCIDKTYISQHIHLASETWPFWHDLHGEVVVLRNACLEYVMTCLWIESVSERTFNHERSDSCEAHICPLIIVDRITMTS